MAFFNFIETFFFISLGITFVLILLLVYHFKQRMTGLEQKCDTMFEIINDVVKELNLLRIQNTMQQPTPGFFQPMRNFMPPFNIDEILNKNSSDVFDGANNQNDDESEESSDVGDSDEDEDEDEDDEADDIVNNSVVEESHENVVKIINVNQETLTELDVDELANLDGDEDDDEDEDEHEDEDHEEVNGEGPETEAPIEPILVEKIEPIEEVETNTDSIDHKDSDKDVYKKMSLGALKALVISKGLCSDARTLRKNDLLKLLEAE
jgi:hypothetical protein